MDSLQLIDAQFNRAVEIIQGLPKTGPIQTGYEEKLTMYSLYKQATTGNVTGSRPGLFDMLGRAKWDAWAKHRDLDQYEARWLYVDALLKALSKYSDKTVARDLIDELHSYGGDTSNLVSSYTLTRAGSRGSSSSSAATEDHALLSPSHLLHDFRNQSAQQHTIAVNDDEGSEDGEAGDESCDLPVVHDVLQHQRPLSSASFSSRYKTPLAGSHTLSSPPPRRPSVPPTQPLPNFETISAFGDPATGTFWIRVFRFLFGVDARFNTEYPVHRSPLQKPYDFTTQHYNWGTSETSFASHISVTRTCHGEYASTSRSPY
ncbi:acyl CoA binding protein-domain-containing protein [Chiua virens]|nr:acyl CoA binding protein-domain-containing protein [Chiua virens]